MIFDRPLANAEFMGDAFAGVIPTRLVRFAGGRQNGSGKPGDLNAEANPMFRNCASDAFHRREPYWVPISTDADAPLR